MKGRWLASFALGGFFLLVGTSAEAQAQAYVGGLGGGSVPRAEASSNRPIYGLLAGARLHHEWGVGAFFKSSNKRESVEGVDRKFAYDMYGFEGSFHFDNVADGAFVGARLGFAEVSRELAAGQLRLTPLVWGVFFGYDHFLKEFFSLGAEGGFMVMGAEKGSLAGVTIEEKRWAMLNFNLSVKFWF